MKPIYNDELTHFGVKGMKWGHHKTQVESTINKISTIGETHERPRFGYHTDHRQDISSVCRYNEYVR